MIYRTFCDLVIWLETNVSRFVFLIFFFSLSLSYACIGWINLLNQYMLPLSVNKHGKQNLQMCYIHAVSFKSNVDMTRWAMNFNLNVKLCILTVFLRDLIVHYELNVIKLLNCLELYSNDEPNWSKKQKSVNDERIFIFTKTKIRKWDYHK